MAVAVNYKNDEPEIGVYGLKNPFAAIITRFGTPVFNLTYKVKVTFVNTGQFVEKFITPIDAVGIVNPLLLIEDFMFNEYTGQTESSAPNSFGKVTVEVGESSSTAADLPPTFAGYTESSTFVVYNGYEPFMMDMNYRDPNWYKTAPYKLAKVKKTLYLYENDIEILSMPSLLNGIDDTNPTNLKNRVTKFYDAAGDLLLTDTTDLTIRPSLTGVAYWNININPIFVTDTEYVEVYLQYQRGVSLSDTEKIRIYRKECNPKQGRYRLRWANNYDGDEYQNFSLASDRIVQVSSGKRILSDGINYNATTFEALTNINNPNITEVGKKVTNLRKLRTDWLKQEELDALDGLYKSESVLMFDPDNNILPVIVRDRTITITDVKNELVKIEVTVEIANIER